MAKKGRQKNNLASSPRLHDISLREENVGRKHVNPPAVLKLQHLQRLAIWAGGEAPISPLAAHFGRMLAASAEFEGIPLDRSIVSCQRCETVLQPGYNCTVRIEKNANGAKCHRRSGFSKNNVVCTCHFCSHRNVRKGTPKGHMQGLLASRPRPISELKPADSITMTISKSDDNAIVANNLDGFSEYVGEERPLNVESTPQKEVASNIPAKDCQKTPSTTVSEKEKRKITECKSTKGANSATNYAAHGSGKDSGTSSKRRRKGWSGLREVTMSSEREKEKRMNNLAIPFLM
ncbi:hypothetical protein Taro_039607 [Colocasia esculenta]|uniref:Uncharacterized protein n=1 Tax=Colocasia esculenta TaxID=4460 RepID=A0A843WG93_COLES|nr:hypothetical protein [Colocasia esculenta]